MSVNDATPVSAGMKSLEFDNASTCSHDTQMSWLQTSADVVKQQRHHHLTSGVSSSVEKPRQYAFSSPSRSRTASSSSQSRDQEVRRRERNLNVKTSPGRRPLSVVETTKPHNEFASSPDGAACEDFASDNTLS